MSKQPEVPKKIRDARKAAEPKKAPIREKQLSKDLGVFSRWAGKKSK